MLAYIVYPTYLAERVLNLSYNIAVGIKFHIRGPMSENGLGLNMKYDCLAGSTAKLL